MTPHEAANHLRPNFHLESMPPEDRHHVLFVEAVATELGVEHTSFNLHQVAAALDAADIHPESNEYPKMLYARQHHVVEGVAASVYDQRNDFVWAHVYNEDQARRLGSDWVENPADLPERGETPVYAAPTADPEVRPIDDQSRYFEPVRDTGAKVHPDSEPDKLTGIGQGSVGIAETEPVAEPTKIEPGTA